MKNFYKLSLLITCNAAFSFASFAHIASNEAENTTTKEQLPLSVELKKHTSKILGGVGLAATALIAWRFWPKGNTASDSNQASKLLEYQKPSAALPSEPTYINKEFESIATADFLKKNFGDKAAVAGSLEDRLLGVVAGTAYGDAFGTQKEFENRPDTEDLTTMGVSTLNTDPMRTFLKNNLGKKDLPSIEIGAFTDDTSMMLCLSKAVVDLKKAGLDFSKLSDTEQQKATCYIMEQFNAWAKGEKSLFAAPGFNVPERLNIKDDDFVKDEKGIIMTKRDGSNKHPGEGGFAVLDIGNAIKDACKTYAKMKAEEKLAEYPPKDLNKNLATNGVSMRNAAIVGAKTVEEAAAIGKLNNMATHAGCKDNEAMNVLFSKAVWIAAHTEGTPQARKTAYINTLLNDDQKNPAIDGYIKPLIEWMKKTAGNNDLANLTAEQKKLLIDHRMTKRETLQDQIFDKKYKSIDSAHPNDYQFGCVNTRFDSQGFLISSSGGTAQCLASTVWCLATTDNATDAIQRAANLYDDADTAPAITGQAAGAIYGAQNLNQTEWNKVLKKEWMFSMAKELIDCSKK